MPSDFKARGSSSYERLMGRWSRRLAPLFILNAGIADAEDVLEIGCGTGSLTYSLAHSARLKSLTAIDFAETYIDSARAIPHAENIEFEQGDACALRFADASFDRCFSMLVLHFIPKPEVAIAEMRRVTRPGGIVAAAVWDAPGGMPGQRMFWDTAAMLEPSAMKARARALAKLVVAENGMARLWAEAGLLNITQTSLHIRMNYLKFSDYWTPLLGGEGGIGAYLETLSESRRAILRRHVRSAYLAGSRDGPRSFTATAWACRGEVAR